MFTQWKFEVAGGAAVLLAAMGMIGCEEIVDHDPNVQVLNDGEVADDDHIDFTPVDDEVTFRVTEMNGTESNGTNMNGARMNGARMNGARMNGSILNSITQLASTLSNVQFSTGSLLSAFDGSSTKVGAQLINMTFNMGIDPNNTGTDQPAKIKVANVVQSSVQSDVYFYSVQYEKTPGVWESLCADSASNPIEGIPLNRAWDPNSGARLAFGDALTWACRGAALAKAIEWGYRPWVSAAMEDAHEAAVRMIRADYCGNGNTHTTNGNAIDVSDKWNIQVPDTTWPIEAKWGPDGAVCLNTPRKLQWPRSSIECAASLPYCTSDGTSTGTPNTSASQYGGLLMTRAVPNNNPSAY